MSKEVSAERPSAKTSSITVSPAIENMCLVAIERGVQAIEALADEWRALCAEGLSNEPFFRPEWISTYYEAFAGEQELLVLTARIQGRLRAVLPLLRVVERHRGIPVRQLRAAANAHSCRFDGACAPGEEGVTAVRAIWNSIAKLPGWDVMILPTVPQGGCIEVLASAARASGFPVGRTPSADVAFIELGESAASSDFGDTLPPNSRSRSNYRRCLRQAREKHKVSFRRVDRADPAALQEFFHVEASGWKGASGSAILCNEATRKFYENMAAAATKFGYFDLYLLRFDDRLAAAHLGLTFNHVHFALKIGYDESLKKFAPGHLMLGGLLQDLAKRGVTTFDFIGPVTPWERVWTNHVRPHFTHCIYRRNPVGYGLYAGESYLVPRLRKLRRSSPDPNGRT